MKTEDKLKKLKANLIMRIYSKGIRELPYNTPEEYIEEIAKYFNVQKTISGWLISSGRYAVLLERDEIIYYIERSDVRKYIKPVKPEYKKLTDI